MHWDLHSYVIVSLHHQNWIIFSWKRILASKIWSFKLLEVLMLVFKLISNIVCLKSTINIGYCLADNSITNDT